MNSREQRHRTEERLERSIRIQVIMVLTLYTMAGCADVSRSSREASSAITISERRCGPPSDFRPPVPRRPVGQVNPGERPRQGLVDIEGFSPRALEVADTIGALSLVTELPSLGREAARDNKDAAQRFIHVRQLLSDRILLALLDVKSVAAEADCEEERADQLADRLQEMRERRTRHLTIFALIGSGVGGVISGGLALAGQGTAAAVAGITAGTTEFSFGSMALLDDIQHDFQHERNLLSEVWERPTEPALIPPSVWRFLNRPLRDDPARRSLRETLIARWRQDGRLGEVGSEIEQRRVALFFGKGGAYEIEDLRARAAMLDLLEADINLMSHDLDRLLQEVLARETFSPSIPP